eukprot:scaffold28338_cov38-Cyclotella_meneghiniana.AAC.1
MLRHEMMCVGMVCRGIATRAMRCDSHSTGHDGWVVLGRGGNATVLDYFMIFECTLVVLGWANAQVQCGGVSVCCVEGVSQIHHEGVRSPSETVFNGRVGKTCSMKEVTSGNAKGMRAPKPKGIGARWKVVH